MQIIEIDSHLNSDQKQALRTNIIKIRMTDSEYKLAKIRANEAGYPLATFARYATLMDKLTDKTSQLAHHQFISQLAWIGNNINQIAKGINTANANQQYQALDLYKIGEQLENLVNELSHLRALTEQEVHEK